MKTRDLFGPDRPVRLNDVAFPPELKVLLLGPHPDDFDAMGVTMRLFRDNGNPIHVAVLSSSSGVQESYAPDPSPAAHAAIRDEEQRRSCRFFGLPDAHLDLMHLDEDHAGQAVQSAANLDRIRAKLADVRPDLVFLPHGDDTNTGHQRTAAMFACLAAAAEFPITACLVRDPKTIASRVDAYTPFEQADADWKAELLRFHDSQHQRNLNTRGHGFDHRLLEVNRAVAAELDLDAPYAEAFELAFWNQ